MKKMSGGGWMGKKRDLGMFVAHNKLGRESMSIYTKELEPSCLGS